MYEDTEFFFWTFSLRHLSAPSPWSSFPEKVPDILTFSGKYTRALSFENFGQESGKYLDTVGLLGCSTTVSTLN